MRYALDLDFVLDYYADDDGKPDPLRPGYPESPTEIALEARTCVARWGVPNAAAEDVLAVTVAEQHGFPEIRFASDDRDVLDAIRFYYHRGSLAETIATDDEVRAELDDVFPIDDAEDLRFLPPSPGFPGPTEP